MADANTEDLQMNVVRGFVEAYNAMDVEKMVSFLHPDIVFKNITDGEETVSTKGIEEFRKLALKGLDIFQERRQEIIYSVRGLNTVHVEVEFHAVLAKDIPQGYMAGDEFELGGKSEYGFKDDLIIYLVDES